MTVLGHNPLYCVNCNLEIPLDDLPLSSSLINALAHWNSLDDAMLYVSRLAGIRGLAAGVEVIEPTLIGWVLCLFALAWIGQSRLGVALEKRTETLPAVAQAFAAGAVVALAYALSAGENRAFIYFQF